MHYTNFRSPQEAERTVNAALTTERAYRAKLGKPKMTAEDVTALKALMSELTLPERRQWFKTRNDVTGFTRAKASTAQQYRLSNQELSLQTFHADSFEEYEGLDYAEASQRIRENSAKLTALTEAAYPSAPAPQIAAEKAGSAEQEQSAEPKPWLTKEQQAALDAILADL